MSRPTARDRLADLGCFLFAATFSVATSDVVVAGRDLSEATVFHEQLVGGLACAALFLRRRWAVQLALVLLVAGKLSHFVTGPTLVALFTVAAHRSPRTTRWVAAAAAVPLVVFVVQRPDPDLPATTSGIVYFALVAAAFGWGLYVRSRRRLVEELRDRAVRAEAEAQRAAREDIAREMHDVLAHRLSLLSVHAGALEYHPDAPPAEVRRAAGVIRDSAHQALEDLREIIGVLRSPVPADGAERPQPTLADLPRLAAESRGTGTPVTLDQAVAEPAALPAPTGRTAYRIVQEGLTNARKHAPEQPVTVTVSGGPGEGLAVEVRNPLPAADRDRPIPGAGHGLVGLAERVRLADGRLEHGSTGAEFRLRAWLPWSGPRRPAEPDPTP
ncbi:sensor histidine kinase [Streptomyces sp. NRRL S-87]|uniref:sensor histidine kinase n=1 Tax=Streptomyces sp. NRRL S-87 TaxID=1463920 RepID=UPI00068DF314|nr:histidine kinase [Streptomyces sp. NRRL S-87]